MESLAAVLPHNAHNFPDRMTMFSPHPGPGLTSGGSGMNGIGDHLPFLDSPEPDVYVNHAQASNLRGSVSGNDTAGFDNQVNGEAKNEENTGAGTWMADGENPEHSNDYVGIMVGDNGAPALGVPLAPADQTDPFSLDDDQDFTDYMSHAPESEMSVNPKRMNAYAQLEFPDGQYLVTSTELILGRDPVAQRAMKKSQKLERKVLKAERRKKEIAEAAAKAALEKYMLEPSHGSQHGEEEDADGPSKSGESLEGRPAKGLASTYSEQGGIVAFENPEEEARRKRRKTGHSSTSNSIAPSSLHPFHPLGLGDVSSPKTFAAPADADSPDQSIFLPIHPQQPEDIKKLSKEHLRIFYNEEARHWQLEILGRGAFVFNAQHQEKVEGSNELVPKYVYQGSIVELPHDTVITIASLSFTFKLPQRKAEKSRESLGDGDELSEGAEHDVAEVDSDGLSDVAVSDVEETPAATKQKKLKEEEKVRRKSSGGKKPVKLNLKKRLEEDAPVEAPPEVIDTRKVEEKLLEAFGRLQDFSQPEQTQEQSQEQSQPQIQQDTQTGLVAPSVTPTFEPGSVLEGVPVHELPAKRKGPGRPPKNGLISKRDQGIIRRKIKEYQKRGETVPPFDELVSLVRQENKVKEAAAKAAARGEQPPPMQTPGIPVMQSIEIDPSLMTPTVPSAPVASQEDPIPMEIASQEMDTKASPKRQRTYRSPSPMKPREECTEEELKKPNHTYYITLDEILAEGPPEGMELQQIYDKICKKYPYYRYGVEGNGWQSSVRHNLKQHERFRQVQKQGKGWLWAINQEIPFDKEKKRKPTPPPMSRPPLPYHMQTGQTGPPAQYGAPGYIPYGQQPTNGQAPYQPPPPPNPAHTQYASPYGQPGQPGQYGPPPQQPGGQYAQPNSAQFPYQPQQPPQGQPQPNGTQYNQQPPPQRQTQTPQPTSATPQPATAPQPIFTSLVSQIMDYRTKYLAQYTLGSDEYTTHEEVFKKCVDWISELQLKKVPNLDSANDEERRVYAALEKMMLEYQAMKDAMKAAAAGDAQSSGPANAPPPAAPVNHTNYPNGAATPVPQTPQQQVPQQQAPQQNSNAFQGGVQAPQQPQVLPPVTPHGTQGQPGPHALGQTPMPQPQAQPQSQPTYNAQGPPPQYHQAQPTILQQPQGPAPSAGPPQQAQTTSGVWPPPAPAMQPSGVPNGTASPAPPPPVQSAYGPPNVANGTAPMQPNGTASPAVSHTPQPQQYQVTQRPQYTQPPPHTPQPTRPISNTPQPVLMPPPAPPQYPQQPQQGPPAAPQLATHQTTETQPTQQPETSGQPSAVPSVTEQSTHTASVSCAGDPSNGVKRAADDSPIGSGDEPDAKRFRSTE